MDFSNKLLAQLKMKIWILFVHRKSDVLLVCLNYFSSLKKKKVFRQWGEKAFWRQKVCTEATVKNSCQKMIQKIEQNLNRFILFAMKKSESHIKSCVFCAVKKQKKSSSITLGRYVLCSGESLKLNNKHMVFAWRIGKWYQRPNKALEADNICILELRQTHCMWGLINSNPLICT